MMKSRFSIFLLLLIAAIGLIVNSCKKETQDNIQLLFTKGPWQLASVQVSHFVGASQVGLTDTLGVNCLLTQVFKFNADNTCTYTNFDCVPQPNINAHWSLSSNKLVLYSDMTCLESVATRDSTATGDGLDTLNQVINPDSTVAVKPFQTTQIVNLGQYSLVLRTGDLQSFYTPTQKRTIIQYGFVRIKSQ